MSYYSKIEYSEADKLKSLLLHKGNCTKTMIIESCGDCPLEKDCWTQGIRNSIEDAVKVCIALSMLEIIKAIKGYKGTPFYFIDNVLEEAEDDKKDS